MGCLLMDCFSQPEEVKASIADGLLTIAFPHIKSFNELLFTQDVSCIWSYPAIVS